MNIKQLLIEKERAAYLNNDTALATFLASTLDYVISLEEQVNKSDADKEMVWGILDLANQAQDAVNALREKAAEDMEALDGSDPRE